MKNVRLEVAWRRGEAFGFPRSIMAVVLGIYEMQRRLVVLGCATQATRTSTAIVAGSKMAMTLLRLVLIGPMDRLLSLYPSLNLKVYADDIK